MRSLDNYILLLVKVIVTIIMVILTKHIVPILKEKYDLHVNDKIKSIVKDTVEAAEQTIKGSGQGSIKKTEVLKYVIKFLDDQNIKVDADLLNTMIESAVFVMNNKQ